MIKKFSGENCALNGECTKVYWESSLGPYNLSRDSKKISKSFFEKGGKLSLGNSPYGNPANLLSKTKFELDKEIPMVKIRKLKTREYSLPIVTNSKVFTTTKTKVFSMGLQSPREGFLVHKYFVPRRLPNPRQFLIKNLNIREKSGQEKDISKFISKKVKKRTKLSTVVQNMI